VRDEETYCSADVIIVVIIRLQRLIIIIMHQKRKDTQTGRCTDNPISNFIFWSSCAAKL
jgi:hypothetical protein